MHRNTRISPQQLPSTKHQPGKAIVLDVRTPEEHHQERIPDVYNLPLDQLGEHIDALKSYDTVYLHCQSGRRSQEAAALLALHQINVIDIDGGIAAWKDAGKNTIRPKNTLPIMQQVLAIAGFLIILGSLATTLLHPLFLLLPAGVGLGLLYAGLSGNCMMAMVLRKMPWNAAPNYTLPWMQ